MKQHTGTGAIFPILEEIVVYCVITEIGQTNAVVIINVSPPFTVLQN